MSVVTGALGTLAPKLLQLLRDEYKLQKGVKKQVQWLSDELNSIYAFLSKVAEVPWDRIDVQVKVWAREVREASYDMEDVLDTFLVRVDGADPADPSRLKRAMKKMGKVFSKTKARRDIAGAIEDIKKHLEEVAERRLKYRLDDIMSKPASTTSTIDPRLTAMYKEVSQLIGVDKSSDELISMLMPSDLDGDGQDKNITKKISVVGVGGLGKTTLAKVVYDKLKSRYECGAFVSIGREHDLVKVFKDILFDLDKCKYQNIHNDGRGANLLIRELREFLGNKRYSSLTQLQCTY
jgi:disease resistance protein RPM1